jgi:hypothetical protein
MQRHGASFIAHTEGSADAEMPWMPAALSMTISMQTLRWSVTAGPVPVARKLG